MERGERQHGAGEEPDQFGSAHVGLTGDGIKDSLGPKQPRVGEIARDLYDLADLQRQSTQTGSAYGVGDMTGPGQVGFCQPQVVGDQDRPGADGGGARHWR